jgi:membrane protein YqaA with SNARE-associated domain
MFKRLYQWMLRAAESPRAVRVLGLLSFAESSFFPIAPDLMLVPMMLARPPRAFFYAAVTTASSVLGGAGGYAIGYFLFRQIGQPILAFYGYDAQFSAFAQGYNEQGLWIVFAAGLTPLPYKIFTIASGLTHMNFALFMGASLVSRALRFFLEAALLWKFGDKARIFIEKRLGLLLTGAVILLLGGFWLLKYIF